MKLASITPSLGEFELFTLPSLVNIWPEIPSSSEKQNVKCTTLIPFLSSSSYRLLKHGKRCCDRDHSLQLQLETLGAAQVSPVSVWAAVSVFWFLTPLMYFADLLNKFLSHHLTVVSHSPTIFYSFSRHSGKASSLLWSLFLFFLEFPCTSDIISVASTQLSFLLSARVRTLTCKYCSVSPTGRCPVTLQKENSLCLIHVEFIISAILK